MSGSDDLLDQTEPYTKIRMGRRSGRVRRLGPEPLLEDLTAHDWFAAVVTNSKADLSERTARAAGLATFLPREKKRRWSNHIDRSKRVRSDKLVTKFPGLLFIGFPSLPEHYRSRIHLYPWHLVERIYFCRGVLGVGKLPVRIPLQPRIDKEGKVANIGLIDVFEECRKDFSAARQEMPTGREYEPGDIVVSTSDFFEGLRFKVIDIKGRYARVAAPLLGGPSSIEVEVGSLAKVEG